MLVVATKHKDYSVQFKSQAEFDKLYQGLMAIDNPTYHTLAQHLKQRLSDQYAYANIKLTSLLFANEVPSLLRVLLSSLVDDSAPSHVMPSKKRHFWDYFK